MTRSTLGAAGIGAPSSSPSPRADLDSRPHVPSASVAQLDRALASEANTPSSEATGGTTGYLHRQALEGASLAGEAPSPFPAPECEEETHARPRGEPDFPACVTKCGRPADTRCAHILWCCKCAVDFLCDGELGFEVYRADPRRWRLVEYLAEVQARRAREEYFKRHLPAFAAGGGR
jgi:hypothetical protein